MTKKIILSASLSISVLLFICCASEKPASPLRDLNKLLPEACELGEWESKGTPQEYKGEDLFLYINGGAEIYHEYGFDQVIVQDYINRDGKSISLEIFEMADSESAYGIYTFKTSADGKELSLGDDAQLEDYYMNFWKGNFLITLTGFDEHEVTVKGLQEIAREVDAKIKVRGKRPHLSSVLPEKGLNKASIKYFNGNLALYNSYPFFTQDVFNLKEGIKGDYKTGYSIYIINYKNDEESQKTFNETRISFEKSPRYKNFNSVSEKLFHVEDERGKPVFISHFKRYILIVMETTSLGHAKEIFSRIQESLDATKGLENKGGSIFPRGK